MKNNKISTPIRTRIHDRKGGTLISLIAVMLILGVLGVSVITFTHTSEHSYLSANAGSRAYYLAESGLRYAQQLYCSEPDEDLRWLHGRQRTLTLSGGEQVDIIRIAGSFWATAVVDAGTAQEARARVPMPLSLCVFDPENNPADEFAIFGEIGISLGNNTVIQGDVAITDGNVDIQGDVDGSILAGDITMTSSDSTVAGDIYSSGLVDIRTGTVTGDIHSANGITLRSAQSTVFEGWLFSEGPIILKGKSEVRGHIYACGVGVLGNVSIGGSAIIGTAADPIEIRATGDVTLSGSAIVYGVVYAGGSIVVGGTINGDSYAGGTITNPDSISGIALQNSATYVKKAFCPDLSNLEDLNLPDSTEFTAGGTDISVPKGKRKSPSEYFLAPGTYGDLSSSNNAANTNLYLNAGPTGHGNYYFESFALGRSMTLYLDLSGTYDIRIFVLGEIEVGRKLNVLVSTDGTNYIPMNPPSGPAVDPLIAARVYWESHDDFSLGNSSNWFGTVYTPDGNLSVASSSYLIGSFFSGGGHNIQSSTVYHVPPNYFAEE